MDQPDTPDLLDELLADEPPPFAVLHRPHVHGDGVVEVMTGDVVTVSTLAELPLTPPLDTDLLVAVPFRQIAERGFDCVDDGAPMLALRIRRRARVPLGTFRERVPDGPAGFVETGYDVPDADYEATVRAVLEGEIACGAGSNFVLHRSLTGTVPGPVHVAALGALRRLLAAEQRAYWTFAVHLSERTFVGATPERHVSLHAGVIRMNPISGTLRYPREGWASDRERRAAVMAFLSDPKERDELAMVVDEELKMMARVGDRGGRVLGPYLKEMAHLAHTEYVLEGRTSWDVREVLRATMFAPTVTGSPIRNACRVIARHERRGRGYYGGVLALIGRDAAGRQTLDAPILIRTAELSPDGVVRLPAGATLVRGSRPEAELAETRAKAAGVLAALQSAPAVPGVDQANRYPGPILDDAVHHLLTSRNATLSRFWLDPQPAPPSPGPGSPRITVLDAEDDFTAMLAHVVRSLGFAVDLRSWTDAEELAGVPGIAVLGPGPGDPRQVGDPRIRSLRAFARRRLAAHAPTLAVCLGHQVVAAELALRLERLPAPHQGVQHDIHLFGQRRTVGFYNSYVALAPRHTPAELAVSADPRTGWVHALRRPALATLQFHAESVLTTEGPQILREQLSWLTAHQP